MSTTVTASRASRTQELVPVAADIPAPPAARPPRGADQPDAWRRGSSGQLQERVLRWWDGLAERDRRRLLDLNPQHDPLPADLVEGWVWEVGRMTSSARWAARGSEPGSVPVPDVLAAFLDGRRRCA